MRGWAARTTCAAVLAVAAYAGLASPSHAAGFPSFLPPGALNRSASPSDHWVSSGRAPGGYGFESTLGFMATTPGSGRHAIYSCLAGGDQFLSVDASCEGQRIDRFAGWLYDSPGDVPINPTPIYRCTIPAGGDHFASIDAGCEGQHVEALLGYTSRTQQALARYTTPPAGDHLVTTRGAPGDASFEFTLGFLRPSGGAGLHPLFSCFAGGDQFVSPADNCEGQAFVGIEGFAYDSAPPDWPPSQAIYRCTANGNGDHFVSPDPGCEGQHAEASIGFVALTHPALDRYVSASDHWITTRGVPGGFEFESTLGYLFQQGGPGRSALYSCLSGGDQFMSPASDCEGQRVVGQDGWVSSTPESDGIAVYRCTVNGSGDHFVSVDRGCEGQHVEALLGYVAGSEGTAFSSPPVDQLPAPVVGTSVNVVPEPAAFCAPNCTVRVERPGEKRFETLSSAAQVPLGSRIDTTHGQAFVRAARGVQGALQDGRFRGARFATSQARSSGLLTVSLLGRLPGCHTRVPRGGAPKAVAARRRTRTLFGNVHGRFRSRGRSSSATVRGTQWVQKDTCSGTLTIVKRGTVVVRDFAKRRNKVVKSGHRYFARARRRHR
jgi:hypothetical protein